MKKEPKKDSKLYDFDFEMLNANKKTKKIKADKKSASKNKKKKSKNISKKELKNKNYEDEIIIGVTKYPKEENKKNNKQKNIKRRNNNKNIEKYKEEKYNKKIKKKKKQQIDPVNQLIRKERIKKIVKITSVLLIIGLAVVLTLLSPIFNIKEIEIIGNNNISKEEIISLSQIQKEENIFKVLNIKTIDKIKNNAYINEVDISKKLPNKIQIKIKEREPSYSLEYGNGYVYLNNQGYMLEIASIKKEYPILTGITTSKENYKAGNRLDEKDLIKLGTVIKIMDVAKANKIDKLITKIDISDINNYTLYFEKEQKIAYLGDCSDLETRMLFLVGILKEEKENSGEIFINMNLNKDNAYFRENV